MVLLSCCYLFWLICWYGGGCVSTDSSVDIRVNNLTWFILLCPKSMESTDGPAHLLLPWINQGTHLIPELPRYGVLSIEWGCADNNTSCGSVPRGRAVVGYCPPPTANKPRPSPPLALCRRLDIPPFFRCSVETRKLQTYSWHLDNFFPRLRLAMPCHASTVTPSSVPSANLLHTHGSGFALPTGVASVVMISSASHSRCRSCHICHIPVWTTIEGAL